MLKIHGIEDHLVDQMRQFNGIVCFLEDFVEQAHQFGMKDEKRTANMPDRSRKYNSHSLLEVASQNTDIIQQPFMAKSCITKYRGNCS